MAWPILGAVAGAGKIAGGATAAGGGAGIWGWLEKLLGGMGKGGMMGGGGMVGNTVPQTSGSYIGQVQGMQSGAGRVVGRGGEANPYTSQAGQPVGNAPQQGGSQQQLGALKTWQNANDNANMFFSGLQAFGKSLGGLQKEGLNPLIAARNTPPVIFPNQLSNPGTQDLMALMQAIQSQGR